MSGYLIESITYNDYFQGAARKVQTDKNWKKVILKGKGSLGAFFSLWLRERLEVFWTSYMSGYLMEPIRGIEDLK